MDSNSGISSTFNTDLCNTPTGLPSTTAPKGEQHSTASVSL